MTELLDFVGLFPGEAYKQIIYFIDCSSVRPIYFFNLCLAIGKESLYVTFVCQYIPYMQLYGETHEIAAFLFQFAEKWIGVFKGRTTPCPFLHTTLMKM